MSTTITQVYRVAQGGMTPAALAAAVAAVPIPTDVVEALGALVASDVTTSPSGFAVRTITFSIVPSVAATAVALIDSDGHVTGVTSLTPGSDYPIPPIIRFLGGGGAVIPQQLAHARAWLKIVGVSIISGGASYSANATATVVGGPAPSKSNAVVAKLSLTIAGGVITGVSIVNPGNGYTSVPNIVITDTTGSGGEIVPSMGVGEIEISDDGDGYNFVPTVAIDPAFKFFFPDGSDQGAALTNTMLNALQSALSCPISADPPIVA